MGNKGIIYKDLGLAKALAAIKESGITRIRVGVMGSAAEEPTADERLTVGEAAIVNELGSDDGHIPARSFLREPLSHSNTLVVRLFTRMMQEVINGTTGVHVAADKLGEQLVQVVRSKIMSGIGPDNAAGTVQKKGFDHPLVATEKLYNAISHEVIVDPSASQSSPSENVENTERAENSENAERAANVENVERAERNG